MPNKTKKSKKLKNQTLSKHQLYEAAVQDVDVDYEFFQRVFKSNRGRKAVTLREDFCGTAVLACEWVKRRKKNIAYGVDLDREVLEWSEENRQSLLTKDQRDRLHIDCDDVRSVRSNPTVDIIAALNFSYSCFQTRKELLHYFKWVYENLNDDGLLMLDAYGGPTAMEVVNDVREIPASRDWAGNKIPAFTYYWDQSYFNFVKNHTICNIHFKVPGEKKRKKAFTYDWRLYSAPELRDILTDVGFKRVDMYLEGWDDDDEDTDGVMRKRQSYEHMLAWFSYMVAVK